MKKFTVIFLLFLFPVTYNLFPIHADWTLDLIPPTASIGANCTNCTTGQTSTVTVLCADTGGSGCSTTNECSINSSTGPWTASPCSVTSNATVYGRSRDNAGNWSTNLPSVTITFTASTYTLTVTKAGTGTGTVTSSPAGISCGADCSENYSTGTSVALTAAASAGSSFTGWSNCSTSTSSPLTVTMDNHKTCTAIFNLIPPPNCNFSGPQSLAVGQAGTYSQINTANTTSWSWTSSPAGGTFTAPLASSTNWSASSANTYTVTLNVSGPGGSSACNNSSSGGTVVSPLPYSYPTPAYAYPTPAYAYPTPAYATPPWIQTTGGDVHSN